MPLVVIAVTTISCDGSEEMPCPDNALSIHESTQSLAIRLARKKGWMIGTDFLCPDCALVSIPAMPIALLPQAAWSEVPAVRAARTAVLHG